MKSNELNVKSKRLPLNWILAGGVVFIFAINNLIFGFLRFDIPDILITFSGHLNIFTYFACLVAAGISFIYLIKRFTLLNFAPILISLSPLVIVFIILFHVFVLFPMPNF